VEGVGSLADTFKNSSLDVVNTDLTAVYTVPTAAPGVTGTAPTFPTTGLIKSIVVASDSANATLVDIKYLDSSATSTFVLFNQKSITSNNTVELLTQPLVLEESDILYVQANAANQVHVTVSVLEITKGDL
jgi:hypothetical protein|tara:strand:- start:700 stop:1092 length:393 start_codon:yes stop_codon:yes gene_type:complete